MVYIFIHTDIFFLAKLSKIIFVQRSFKGVSGEWGWEEREGMLDHKRTSAGLIF